MCAEDPVNYAQTLSLSAVFIRRPVATTLLTLGVAFFGVLSYRALPVSDLPSVDFPTMSISASLPGSYPEAVAATLRSIPRNRPFSSLVSCGYRRLHVHGGTVDISIERELQRDAGRSEPTRRCHGSQGQRCR